MGPATLPPVSHEQHRRISAWVADETSPLPRAHECGGMPCLLVQDGPWRVHIPDPSPETTALIERLELELTSWAMKRAT